MNSEKGYTLVELMFAVVIISISVLAVYQMFIQGNQMISEAYHREQAFLNAQEKINIASAYRAVCDTIPRSLTGTFTEPLYHSDEENPDAILATYYLRVEHSRALNLAGKPCMSTISILYQWVEPNGNELHIELKANVPS